MISVISPIKYGDNEQSRLNGIGSSGELDVLDFIRYSRSSRPTKSCGKRKI